jgi:hypothetical protein
MRPVSQGTLTEEVAAVVEEEAVDEAAEDTTPTFDWNRMTRRHQRLPKKQRRPRLPLPTTQTLQPPLLLPLSPKRRPHTPYVEIEA